VSDEPKRLIGGYFDAPDAALAKRGIEMIYRSNRIAKIQMVGRLCDNVIA